MEENIERKSQMWSGFGDTIRRRRSKASRTTMMTIVNTRGCFPVHAFFSFLCFLLLFPSFPLSLSSYWAYFFLPSSFGSSSDSSEESSNEEGEMRERPRPPLSLREQNVKLGKNWGSYIFFIWFFTSWCCSSRTLWGFVFFFYLLFSFLRGFVLILCCRPSFDNFPHIMLCFVIFSLRIRELLLLFTIVKTMTRLLLRATSLIIMLRKMKEL